MLSRRRNPGGDRRNIVPLVLRRLDLDPAVATAPVLMTFNDMCGFFFALSLANVLLRQLTA